MESLEMIKYKWESGVYDLKDMMKLVNSNQITEEQFFNITSYNYYGILSSTRSNNKLTFL